MLVSGLHLALLLHFNISVLEKSSELDLLHLGFAGLCSELLDLCMVSACN